MVSVCVSHLVTSPSLVGYTPHGLSFAVTPHECTATTTFLWQLLGYWRPHPASRDNQKVQRYCGVLTCERSPSLPERHTAAGHGTAGHCPGHSLEKGDRLGVLSDPDQRVSQVSFPAEGFAARQRSMAIEARGCRRNVCCRTTEEHDRCHRINMQRTHERHDTGRAVSGRGMTLP